MSHHFLVLGFEKTQMAEEMGEVGEDLAVEVVADQEEEVAEAVTVVIAHQTNQQVQTITMMQHARMTGSVATGMNVVKMAHKHVLVLIREHVQALNSSQMSIRSVLKYSNQDYINDQT